MANDNFDNEEPEENDDNLFDDDDFGLPDLEYDELDDDLDLDSGDSEPTAETTEEADASTEEDLSVDLDSIDLDDVDFDAIDAIGEDDDDDAGLPGLDELDDELALDTDLDSDVSSELATEDDDDFGGILEPADESDLDDDDFSSILENDEDTDLEGALGSLEEEDATDMSMVFDDGDKDSDDDFSGLGDFDDEDFADVNDDPGEYTYVGDEEDGSGAGFVKYLIIGLSVIVVAAIGLIAFSGVFTDDDKDPVAPPKTAVKKPATKPATKPAADATKTASTASQGNATKPATKPATSNTAATKPATKPAAKPVNATANAVAAGTVTQLSSRNGKAYVVVASFIDNDLAVDHANKLAKDGKSPYVIPPFGKSKYSRVGIAEFDSFEGAASKLDNYKTEYGDDVWALRY